MTDDANKNPTDGEEVTFLPDAESENLTDPAAELRRLKEKLKVCQKERQEYLEGWQRAKADYLNARKEEEKERAHFLKFSKESLIKEILPALESFHVAFGNKEAWEKVDLNWRMGVQYIYSQLLSVLERNGVALIDPKVGDRFDPAIHSSLATVTVNTPEEAHTIRETLQKGFSLHGKVVQPAKVKVGEYPHA